MGKKKFTKNNYLKLSENIEKIELDNYDFLSNSLRILALSKDYIFLSLLFKKKKKGDIFGEYSFFSENNRECGAQSLEFSYVGYINLDDFKILLKKFPFDHVFKYL